MRGRFAVPLLLVCALLCAACGARLSEEQVAAAGAANGAVGAATGTGTGSGSSPGTGTGTPTTAPGGPVTTLAPGVTAPAGSGTGAPVDPGTGAPAAPVEGAPCTPQPSTEVGVTDTEIKIGNISTISGPVAGFGQTGVNAVRAYVAFVNATGGVCGRQLTLVTGDDGLDAGRNRSETQRLANEVLGFVGAVTVVDDGGADILDGTNIPDVGLTIGARRGAMANNFSPNPIDPSKPGNGLAPALQYFAAQGVTSAAVVWPAQADARFRGQGFVSDLNAAGITNVDTYEVAITETNYANVAQQIENKGSQLVLTALEISGMANLAGAFEDIGYRPQVPFYGAQAYGQQFLQQAGTAAEGTTIVTTFSIFEDAPSVPAMQDFVDWYARTAPGSNPDFFSIMSWAAADMFVDALRDAGPAPTRDSVTAALATQTDYSGDGFLAPRNPPGKQPSPCFAIVGVRNGQWQRIDPASGFINC
jgi:ABC-type branched-subunit amino acid transport system substrate-binding protein